MTAPSRRTALLAACAAFEAEHAIVLNWNAGRVGWEIGEAANQRWWERLEEVASMPAVTLGDMKAKARVLHLAASTTFEQSHATENLITAALAQMADGGMLTRVMVAAVVSDG